ncbi:hypothetical protein GC093_00320 [Paenibacillus sp. LMG 31456]|uniref:N-acetyltransferase domain-containing protein n=1 Tax=Paenibacillus foliorum TaxID=2654974 RepID=A0A972GJ09_9BACL|nr:GNAT family protein [Paenibacillus foliorum]NOU91684.1 hypothetical protein [Paenibacillus foliorum]
MDQYQVILRAFENEDIRELHRWLNDPVSIVNEQAIGLYKKIGFSIEGQLRKHAFSDGQYYDTYIMGLLASEWNMRCL